MGEEQSLQPEMLPLHQLHGHHQQRPWYAKRNVQGGVVAGLACCCLLVFVLAGPKPTVNSDITTDTPVNARDAAAAAAASQKADQAAAAAAAAAGGAPAAASGGKVRVDFYGESLCPDCQHMVRDVLAPMFENGVAKLMSLTYFAFGNVRNNSDGSFAYQHGPAEGKYNRYILCSQKFHPKQEEWFPYVKCLADKMRELDSKHDGCATEQGWDAEEMTACAEGEGGKEEEFKAAEATWALVPKHNFVPWMVVNGVAIGNDYDHLDRYVCAAAPAKGRPEACSQLPQDRQYQGRRRN